jgi:hypothetical protein
MIENPVEKMIRAQGILQDLQLYSRLKKLGFNN